MQCKEWDDANSELFKEPHDEAVHKNSYKSGLYELISASLAHYTIPVCDAFAGERAIFSPAAQLLPAEGACVTRFPSRL